MQRSGRTQGAGGQVLGPRGETEEAPAGRNRIGAVGLRVRRCHEVARRPSKSGLAPLVSIASPAGRGGGDDPHDPLGDERGIPVGTPTDLPTLEKVGPSIPLPVVAPLPRSPDTVNAFDVDVAPPTAAQRAVPALNAVVATTAAAAAALSAPRARASAMLCGPLGGPTAPAAPPGGSGGPTAPGGPPGGSGGPPAPGGPPGGSGGPPAPQAPLGRERRPHGHNHGASRSRSPIRRLLTSTGSVGQPTGAPGGPPRAGAAAPRLPAGPPGGGGREGLEPPGARRSRARTGFSAQAHARALPMHPARPR
jgi:hypothetical protein